jgi:hypothetical protein
MIPKDDSGEGLGGSNNLIVSTSFDELSICVLDIKTMTCHVQISGQRICNIKKSQTNLR